MYTYPEGHQVFWPVRAGEGNQYQQMKAITINNLEPDWNFVGPPATPSHLVSQKSFPGCHTSAQKLFC